MVFKFACFDFLSLPTEIPNNNDKTKSTYYTAQADFPVLTYKWPDDLRVFTYTELKNMTRNFDHSSKIGEGEFGSIYEGTFFFPSHGDDQVFIRRLKGTYVEGHKQWVKEVKVLMSIDHPNLVKLIGYCVEGNKKSGMLRFLVYEHMAGINLGERIFESNDRFFESNMIRWSLRLTAAREIARGLACLHEVTGNKVAFGDLKYSNVHTSYNLDTIKLSNFGLPGLSDQKGLAHVSTEDVGNTEYIAPEYNNGEQLTSKSDVWSYGVLLIELITGRHLLDTNRPTNEQNLLNWVQPYIDSERFEEITDPKIRDMVPLYIQDLCIIANMCLSKKPDSRPEIRQVLEMVNQLITSEQSGTSLAPILQSPVSTDIQRTKSSCLPRICHTKFLKSCFRKKNCCA